MQAPTNRNTSASTARISKLKIGEKQNSSCHYDCVDCLTDSKKSDRSSSAKTQADKGIRTIDFVKHEDFAKLAKLTVNLDRWEYAIYRSTNQQWCSQQGTETTTTSVLAVKGIIRHYQASLEARRENLAHIPVLCRGVNPQVDNYIDRASNILCQECSDIFYYMDLCLFAKEKIKGKPQRIENDLDIMSRALSPFQQWASDFYDDLVEFSEFWLATDNESETCERLSLAHDVEERNDSAELIPAADGSDLVEFNMDDDSLDKFLSDVLEAEQQDELAELPPADVSDLVEFNTDDSADEFFSDDLELRFDEN